MLKNNPILSIVTCTLGEFSDHWLKQYLKIKGAVEFIMVYPPGVKYGEAEDERVRPLTSPLKGEVIQRMLGLLNTSGKYVIALDDDDFLHPDIVEITLQYFEKYADSCVLRLSKEASDLNTIPWGNIPDIKNLPVENKKQSTYLFNNGKALLEIPIAPLNNKFDVKIFYRGRRDHCGIHMENFNNRVWRNDLVKNALTDLVDTLNLLGSIKYIPKWNLDRLLGLYLQAKIFDKKNIIIGHMLPKPSQVRQKGNISSSLRFYFMSDMLLLRHYPQFGYFWNLVLSQLLYLPFRFLKAIIQRLPRKGKRT